MVKIRRSVRDPLDRRGYRARGFVTTDPGGNATVRPFGDGTTEVVLADGTIGPVPAGAMGPHASTHENGGSDELDVTGLPGVLADPQNVAVDAAGAIDGDGSIGDPLAVRVDGTTIQINGSNELEAIGGAAPSMSDPHWEPMTNGDPVNPELVFSLGDVVMTWVP